MQHLEISVRYDTNTHTHTHTHTHIYIYRLYIYIYRRQRVHLSDKVRSSIRLFIWYRLLINFAYAFQPQTGHPRRHQIKLVYKMITHNSKIFTFFKLATRHNMHVTDQLDAIFIFSLFRHCNATCYGLVVAHHQDVTM
jgi:hypothetical protein